MSLPHFWYQQPRFFEEEARLSQALGVRPLTAAVLLQRGLTAVEEVDRFLNPSLDDLGDPSLLPDYAPAAKVLIDAIKNQDLIFIHGDYDVDGVTSAAIFSKFLSQMGAKVHTHVPHRFREGYGIHMDVVKEAHALGTKVFLTCDCGIAAHEQIKAAVELGMIAVVTDHHTVGIELPGATAVINAHRTDSAYPFHELSGAGLVFRVCEGIARDMGKSVASYREKFLDLAALGTIADVMPLVGENRIIARYGLERLTQTQKASIVALKEVSNVSGRVSAQDVGFRLGPRLNATGRLDESMRALMLLLEKDLESARRIAKELDEINTARRSETERTVQEALQLAEEQKLNEDFVVVVANKGWNPGIVGIAASKIVEAYARPAFVLAIDEEKNLAKGSGRSIKGFNLASAIEGSRPLLSSGGGHAMAAGCSFPADNLVAVRESFNAIASQTMRKEDLVKKTVIDLAIQPGELTIEDLVDFQKLEPFGAENPAPSMGCLNVKLKDIRPMGGGKSARVIVASEGGAEQECVAFGRYEEFSQIPSGSQVDLVFRPDINEYGGRTRVQWQLQSMRTAATVETLSPESGS
jgi:single-stranded-DNA-specific exonuclease